LSDSTLRQITQLSKLSFSELQARWRSLFGGEPPAYHRRFLVKRLAYRLQELAYGGLSPSALARATQLVTETGYHLRDADLLILEGRLLSKKDDKKAARTKLNDAIAVARREEKDGCVYQPALDQATRLLQSLRADPPPLP